MKTSALLSLIAIGLVATAVSAATGAYFSDTETSEGNTMEAGILNLKVNGCDGTCTPPVANVVDLKPCLTRYSYNITLLIEDNPGKLFKRISEIMCWNNGQTEPEMQEEGNCTDPTSPDCCPKNELEKYTWLDVEYWNATSGEWEVIMPDGVATIYDTLDGWIYLGEYEPLIPVKFRQSFHLDADVTNWAQTDSCVFTEEFLATQVNAPFPEGCVNCYPIADGINP